MSKLLLNPEVTTDLLRNVHCIRYYCERRFLFKYARWADGLISESIYSTKYYSIDCYLIYIFLIHYACPRLREFFGFHLMIYFSEDEQSEIMRYINDVYNNPYGFNNFNDVVSYVRKIDSGAVDIHYHYHDDDSAVKQAQAILDITIYSENGSLCVAYHSQNSKLMDELHKHYASCQFAYPVQNALDAIERERDNLKD